MTRLPSNPIDHYVVAGNPVAHSQSPFIHAMFARATGQAMRYGRLLCPIDDVDGFTREIRAFATASGGAVGAFDATPGGSAQGPARGCNITVPFKFEPFEAMMVAAHSSDLALRARLVILLLARPGIALP